MRCRLASVLLLGLCVSATALAQTVPAQHDWPMFGGSLESPSSNPSATGITAANVGKLTLRKVELPGTVDASAIYLHGVTIDGARHDAIFVTTTYGKTLAIDADSGAILWTYTPASYARLAGTHQITNSTPVADPDRQYIYAASPDGYIQKLAIANGHLVWRTAITRLPVREKMDSPLKVFRGHVIAVTAGYIGDRPPYQGHVAILDSRNGKLLHVWNTLCSNRTGLLEPGSCPQSDSAIWGRAGAIIDPANGNILVATGNADWNGTTDWGDAVIELNTDATRMLGNYTPANTDYLNTHDLDVGSSSPVWLGHGLIAQGGKDGKIVLLSLAAIAGTAPHKGGELQTVATPGHAMLFSQPAVWQHAGETWLFAADGRGTAAWQLVDGKLQPRWHNDTDGTSPFEAGGLLYVYAPSGIGLHVYAAASGKLIATLACARGHWNSPIVVAGKIILPTGNANAHLTRGELDIWSLPAAAAK
ncbi:MAG TPA: PQQ-binding-like beta-propeller repeat protein [Rhodanobacteraceae bacterium]